MSKKISKTGLLLVLLAFSLVAMGAYYKYTDEQGHVQYTDVPGLGREEVVLPKIQTFTPPALPVAPSSSRQTTTPADTTADTAPKAVKQYKVVMLTPTKEQFYTRDQETVDVTLALSPDLHENDRIRLYLDGAPYGTLYDTAIISVTNLPRGTHTVKAEVVPKSGKGNPKGQTETISFYKQQTIIRQNNPAFGP